MSFNGFISKKLEIRFIQKNTSYHIKSLTNINLNNWFGLRIITNYNIRQVLTKKIRIKDLIKACIIIMSINNISIRMYLLQTSLLA